jgi:diaminobutyrate-2-oxoglutarate transaminase
MLNCPSVKTQIPGPLSLQYLLRQQRRESNARTYPRNLPLAIRRAEGSFVEDMDGNVFIDFLSGAGVLALGHNHPEVVAAIQEQAVQGTHMLDFPTAVKDRFTEAQLAMLPGDMGKRMRVQFCGPTGADAVEAAVKLCKLHTGRSDVVAFHGGFHGSTQSTLAITGLRSTKEHLPNLMPGAHFFPFSHCFRCPLDLSPDRCNTNCAKYLENVLRDVNGGVRRPAAVILELIQGEGGVVEATVEFAREVRRITRELEIPLIADEIQCGCGRSGTWFAFEQLGIEPDVVVASKAIGGGLPAALIFYEAALDTWAPGAHTGTFRGNQLAFAASLATLEVMKRDDVLANVIRQGQVIRERLSALQSRLAIVGDVRGRGLMLGLEVVDPATGQGDPARARRAQRLALEQGLIIELGGRDDVVIRLLPALNVDDTTVLRALAILEDVLLQVAGRDERAVPGAHHV